MAEEMAEEANERRRIIREEDRPDDPFEDEEDVVPSSRDGQKPLRPFEQYVDDICCGRRSLWGEEENAAHIPPRTRQGATEHQAERRSASAPVQMLQSELVSSRFLHVMGQILQQYQGHRIRTVSFSAKGYPRRGELPVMGVYIRKSGTVIFNLLRHFENAAQMALVIDSGFSIHGLIWHSMLRTLLHEIHHSLNLPYGGEETEEVQSTEELLAGQWCETEIHRLVHILDLEPTRLDDEPFFRTCFYELMLRESKAGNGDWVGKQRRLVDAGLIYWDEKSHAAIETMAMLYDNSANQGQQARGDAQEALVKADLRIQDRIDWELKKEQAVKEACETGAILKIDYRANDQRLVSCLIRPVSIFYKDSVTCVEALSESRQKQQTFRLDRIEALTFVA
ncbi:hypothetical protein Dole_0736 [Desulfosudis oleivorans Hxd3]|uniref:WYL domain-containing protein n=2 Tax=Desulfosudis TaxID=2904716 RepID=A8ZV85_DESOH|nr:hypothetical protein Dole_0736 [Desulfosudis oleivorans Hxd3]